MSTPTPGQERFFGLLEIEEARDWALADGIAIHRNFDVDGIRIGGKVRHGPAFHVFGQEPALLDWARRYRLNPNWIQDRRASDGWPPHFDVFGGLAVRIEARRLTQGKETQ
jgi:hypothetical protein